MDPMTLSILGQLGGAVVGLIGRAIAEGDFAKARELRQQMVAEYGEENLPVIDRVIAQEVGPSAFESIRGDGATRDAQMTALDALQNEYAQGGMTEADRAALNVASREVSGRAAGDLANTQQRLARVGQAGNGALNAVLAGQAGQNAANATADMAGRAQMSARDRALRALEASAGLAGDVRGQDFGEAAARAKAADAFNLFNADQRTNAQQANNANAFGSFNAKMGLKDRRNAARGGVVKGYEDSADRTLQTAAGVGQAVQQGAQGAANYGTRQQDIQREDDWRTKRGY